jgi:nucleoid DNA-binding protein
MRLTEVDLALVVYETMADDEIRREINKKSMSQVARERGVHRQTIQGSRTREMIDFPVLQQSIHELFEGLSESISSGNRVEIRGFGIFDNKTHPWASRHPHERNKVAYFREGKILRLHHGRSPK